MSRNRVKAKNDAWHYAQRVYNQRKRDTHLDLLRLVDTLLVIADVKVISHVEELVDILLLTCHLATECVPIKVILQLVYVVAEHTFRLRPDGKRNSGTE